MNNLFYILLLICGIIIIATIVKNGDVINKKMVTENFNNVNVHEEMYREIIDNDFVDRQHGEIDCKQSEDCIYDMNQEYEKGTEFFDIFFDKTMSKERLINYDDVKPINYNNFYNIKNGQMNGRTSFDTFK